MSLAAIVSTVIGIALCPAVAYVGWMLINAVIDLVAMLRGWRGLDRSVSRRPRLTASMRRVRELPPAAVAIYATPIHALPGRQRPALTAGTPAADQKAQVA